jgi:hypothetical protein
MLVITAHRIAEYLFGLLVAITMGGVCDGLTKPTDYVVEVRLRRTTTGELSRSSEIADGVYGWGLRRSKHRKGTSGVQGQGSHCAVPLGISH